MIVITAPMSRMSSQVLDTLLLHPTAPWSANLDERRHAGSELDDPVHETDHQSSEKR